MFLLAAFFFCFIHPMAFLHWLQATTTSGGSGVAISTPGGQLSFQAIIAFVVSYLINVLNNSKASWTSWISPAKPVIAKILSAGTAAAMAAGIVITHTGNFTTGFSLTIAGLSLSGIVNAFSTFLTQWGAQHVFYQAIWKTAAPPSPTQVAANKAAAS